jgi:serine/threonine protein kinase/tetratricopeptide (TPR) repeat protein
MVSHYRIVEKIGAGGMGEVYLAEDTKLKRKVALKFLPSQFAADSDFKARFVREAEATAKLDHPNIVTIYEVSEFQGRPFFAMQLVEGQSLRDLANGKELGIDRIIELAIQICDGLEAAHDKEVVHRDIKPSNIVIDAYGRPKILDFGLAAIQGGEQLTKTGSTLGTVRYMSPEQVQGQNVDHRSDLFSLGVVLYELIAGRTPFDKDNEAATLQAITQDNPEPLARYKSDIPGELQRTVSKLLEKDPSLRYQTAGGVLSDLKRLTAPTQSSMAQVPAKKKVNWPLAVSGLVIIATLITAGIKYWPDVETEKSHEPTEERIMLAVLPFENLGEPEDEYFADGITDEITSKVGILDGLGVIARTSILQYKGTTKRVAEIGSELNVDYILEGTIRWDKSGEIDQVRITPQLIRVSDETHLWADNIQRDLSRIFEVQEEIAINIARAMNVTLISGDHAALDYRPTENLDAYDDYLRASNYLNNNDILKAIELLDKATGLDSNFALAFALKSQAHSWSAFGEELGVSEHTKPARLAYNRAFEIQPDLAEAHLARGIYLNYIERDYSGALKEFEVARQGHVDEASVLGAISGVKIRQGKWNEAVALDQQVMKLDPRSSWAGFITWQANWFIHQYDQALVALERLMSLDPDRAKYYSSKAQIQICMGEDVRRVQESLSEWSRLSTLGGFDGYIEGVTYFRLLRSWNQSIGVEAKISAVKEELLRNPNPKLYYDVGLLYHFKGDKESSYSYIDSALMIANNSIAKSRSDTTGRFEIFDLGHSVYDRLAMGYSLTNRHEQAIEHAQLAMEAMPIEACHF